MKFEGPWKGEYMNEIERAIQARSDGNEGMARVCARRAAGIVIGEYLTRMGYSRQANSAYDRLLLFINLADVDQKNKEIAHHLLLKVNQDRQLPDEVYLISEVIWLKESLLNTSID